MDKRISLTEYYSSPEWAKKRSERLKLDDYRCQRCGFTRALEVHHLNYERLGNEDVSRDLITLCKKCHDEIEARKETVNPVPKTIEHHNAYFAGKITKHDWREPIYHVNFDFYDLDNYASMVQYSEKVSDELTVTGPFFISCDHGCYHGQGKHGVGAIDPFKKSDLVDLFNLDETYSGCMGTKLTRANVFDLCKIQIDKADILFAYIDKNDCYGTIAEIGYAHAKGKDIVICFANETLKETMWFVDRMAHLSGNISNEWIDRQFLSKII